MAVGLSLLLADQTYGYDPNHSPYSEQQHMIKMNMSIVRPVIKLNRTTFLESPSSEVVVTLESSYCYLKSCHLCHKKLQPNDDIYMYKGDQGYCTEECRTKQINIDKVKEEKDERDNYMKNSALRRQHRMMIRQQNSGKCNEMLSMLQDFSSRRRRPVPLRRNGAIFFC